MSRSRLHTTARIATAVAGGSAVIGGLGSLGAASALARGVLTPPDEGPTELEVTEIDDESVTLTRSADTEVMGRYGLWDAERTGHIRMGEIREMTQTHVTREVLGTDFGQVLPGPVRFNQYFFAQPPDAALGLPTDEVTIEAEIGDLPAWFVPAAQPGDRWAILVHGRGALRLECLRAVQTLHDAGLHVLIPAYRNDADAPRGVDGRYTLGLSEWRDIDDAIRYAVRQGARTVTLGGWSMGGAICMQVLAQSDLAGRVSGVFLDCPVLDWGDVLRHHGRINSMPAPVTWLARTVMGSDRLRWLAGVSEPLDVAQTDWVHRAAELTHPMLVMHSVADDFVPIGPSRAVAEARPDLVRLEEWAVARHCRLWNTDPARWEESVREFVAST